MEGTSRIDELEQKFIENPRRYFAPLANEYRKAGNPHQAIAICRAHLAQLPGHMSGQIVYGQALFEGGEHDEARTVFENALGMDRENLIALRHLGDLALRNGEKGTARQFYGKLLEIDPQDTKVIAIVNEMDESEEAQPAATGPTSADEMPTESDQPAAALPIAAAAGTDAAIRHEEEDAMIAEELGYPVPPPHAFVTETMAELYLAQGFRDRALSVYRELAEYRPDDERLRERLAELETPAENADISAEGGTDGSETQVESRREEPPSVESPEDPPDADRSPSIEAPTPSAPEIQAPSEESTSGDSSTVDSPPRETPPSEPDSVEAPSRDEPRAEPEGIAARLTVRDFFATLGRRRPTSRSNGSGANGDADSIAASALAGAFSSSKSPPPPAGAGAPGRESEEDVARFRTWLDGLTGQ